MLRIPLPAREFGYRFTESAQKPGIANLILHNYRSAIETIILRRICGRGFSPRRAG
jgi:hypothetical protein